MSMRMCVSECVYMYVCMYVCICVYIFSFAMLLGF